jgi:hypothetical protein
MANYPTAGLLAIAYALNNVHSSLVDKPVQAPLYDFSSLIGFQEVWDFERKRAHWKRIEPRRD